jgi:hypothetical protein
MAALANVEVQEGAIVAMIIHVLTLLAQALRAPDLHTLQIHAK